MECYAEHRIIRGPEVLDVENRTIALDPDIFFPGRNCRSSLDFTAPYFVCLPHGYRDEHLAKKKEEGTEYQAQNKDRLDQIVVAHPTTSQGYYLIIPDHEAKDYKHR